MAEGAAKWIWENSRASNGSLIVLLAIADECGEEEFIEMKVAELAVKCRLSDKGVRRAVENLEALGELSVEPRPGGASRYALCLTLVKTTGADPGQNDRPVKMTGPEPRSKWPDLPEEPQVNGTPVKTTGPGTSDVLKAVTGSSSAEVKKAPAKRDDRPDVDRLCAHLADRIEGNGSKRPTITQKWRDAARLLMDADKRTEQQVHAAIEWSQDHEFWRANILSMPKLRERYDQLRLQWLQDRAPRDPSRAAAVTAVPVTPTPQPPNAADVLKRAIPEGKQPASPGAARAAIDAARQVHASKQRAPT